MSSELISVTSDCKKACDAHMIAQNELGNLVEGSDGYEIKYWRERDLDDDLMRLLDKLHCIMYPGDLFAGLFNENDARVRLVTFTYDFDTGTNNRKASSYSDVQAAMDSAINHNPFMDGGILFKLSCYLSVAEGSNNVVLINLNHVSYVTMHETWMTFPPSDERKRLSIS